MDALIAADSPRLSGESQEHVELLLSSGVELPPILVHRQTMRVIDGMHRLKVAVLKGEREVQVNFFEGGDIEAFILAVQSNVRHGLPLSLADRSAAAERIVTSCPQLSNRSVAASTGLSPKTIAAIRRRTSGDHPQLNARVGRDGRIRPVDSTVGRQSAARVLDQNPEIPLRELAKAAGISLGTARDVRERLRAGRDPVPARNWRTLDRKKGGGDEVAPAAVEARPHGPASCSDWGMALHNLKKDPSLRFSDRGRMLLRMLDTKASDMEKLKELIASVPPHQVDMIAQLAMEFAKSWREFANELRSKVAESA
ncbi:streptomycin biosynthesis protein [Streptomyces sp. NPDC028722]|uniref:streptomycin biosynthesis protein n=1 Tax=Streptomyces sp. NPDC028722 TaxID=3155016 RepID=UPI0033D789E6